MAQELDLTQKFCASTHSRNGLCIQDRTSFRGQYDFHLDLKHKDASKDYKLHLGESGQRVIFVNRDRAFVLRTIFRLPLTPLNLFIRIIPLYTCAARRNERVCRCLNHSKGDGAPQNESFITIQSSLAQYCELDGHLTVLVPVDREQLAPSVANCVVDRKLSEPVCSYPMGEVTESLICRAGCYTSCLGAQARGALELVVRLEEFENPDYPMKGIKLHGLDRVELRCSSTPSRDIRLFLGASTSGSTSLHSKASLDPNPDTKDCSLSRRRGISEPAATRKSKRLPTLKEPSIGRDSERVSPDCLPTYVDIPTAEGKRRFYVVLAASEEQAKDFRFQVDCRAAYDGTRMSSSAFRTNRDVCRRAEAFLAALYQRNLGNSQLN